MKLSLFIRALRVLRLITDAIPVAIAYADRDERFVFCNSAYAKWNQMTCEQIVGKTVHEVVGDEVYAQIKPRLIETLAGKPSDEEMHIPYRGQRRVCRIHRIPDVSRRRQVVGFAMISDDISDLARYQADLLRAKAAADAASREKTAFIATMSHEIRTALAAISGFSDLLLNAQPDEPDFAKWAATVKRNTDFLGAMINQLLDLSAIEAGRLDVTRGAVALQEFADDIATMLRLGAETKGLQLRLTRQGPLPETILTDPDRLRQILLNIIGNAIKFSDRGVIELAIRRAGASLAFAVTDQGPGIAPEQAANLFKPFSTADRARQRTCGGTGLGLVLAKRLAELLGGDVVLTASAPGRGSTFTVTIDPGPAAQAGGDAPRRGRSGAPAGPAPAVRLDGLRVLVAEDTEGHVELLRRYLSDAGADIATVMDGKAAIERIHGGSFDVVLMDLQMPGMDGYQATLALRRAGYAKPIIALTAHAMKEEQERCLRVGFDDHLAKPIDPRALLTVLAPYADRAPR